MGRVINLRGFNNVYKTISKNKEIIILVLIFLSSVLFGVLRFKGESNNELIVSYLSRYVEMRLNSSFFKIFISSFLTSLCWIVLILILGTSVFGVINVPLILAVFGFFCGNISAFLYSNYSLKGIAFHSVMMLPCELFCIIALLLCSVSTIRFSIKIINLTFSKTVPYSLYNDFKICCYHHLIFSIFILISSLIDALLSVNFLKSFNLF